MPDFGGFWKNIGRNWTAAQGMFKGLSAQDRTRQGSPPPVTRGRPYDFRQQWAEPIVNPWRGRKRRR